MDFCTRQLGGIYNTSETGCQCSSCSTPPLQHQHHHSFCSASSQRRSIAFNPDIHIHTITCCSRCTSIIKDNSSTCNCSTFAATNPPKLHIKKQGWGCKRAGCANGDRGALGGDLNEVLARWLDALLGHIMKSRSSLKSKTGFHCTEAELAKKEQGLVNADVLAVSALAAQADKERVGVDDASISEK